MVPTARVLGNLHQHDRSGWRCRCQYNDHESPLGCELFLEGL